MSSAEMAPVASEAQIVADRCRMLSILLPVRNEGINLRIMLKILRAVVDEPHEVLVVYDSLDDDSIPVVEEARKIYPELRGVQNTMGRGVVNAIRAGVAVSGGDVILIFAADEVGPVLAIEDMIALVREGCDFVSCTRYAHGGRRLGGSIVGAILSYCANWLFHRLCSSPFTDATTGIKMFRKEIFPLLKLESPPVGWTVAFEMAIKAQQAGLLLGEVPIVSIDRLYGGESTFRVGPWVLEYSRWFLWGMRASFNNPGATQTATVRIPKFYR
jgi:glycosyltransferase involved in cell wall biosynthesis